MPPKKSKDIKKRRASSVESTPSLPSCENCKKTLPRTTSIPSHPMCGKCTIENDSDHFTMGYHKVNCASCASLPLSMYRDYVRRAKYFRETGVWTTIKVIQEAEKDLVKPTDVTTQCLKKKSSCLWMSILSVTDTISCRYLFLIHVYWYKVTWNTQNWRMLSLLCKCIPNRI